MQPIRVLIVDDSAVVRLALTRILESDPGIEVVGTALDPILARQKIEELEPDMLTLDVDMPRMDGLTFLRELMAWRPTPVLMVSSHTQDGCELALRCLEIGAIDCISKPASDLGESLLRQSGELIEKVKVVASARVRATRPRREAAGPVVLSLHGPVEPGRVICIGASTGGTEAICHVLERLPAHSPPVLITQHMPAGFTKSFAQRLNEISALEVREAAPGDRLGPGQVSVAAGDHHLELVRDEAGYRVELSRSELVHCVRPSVDVMFRSVAEAAGHRAVGVILTGMGADGADGMRVLKDRGGWNIAQDEATSVVYGMPREAIARGGVDTVLPLEEIPEAITKAVVALVDLP